MADFEVGIDELLEREGGYNNDPADPGGETKYGITKRDYPNEDIRNMTPARASGIYRREFWDRLRLGELLDNHVAWKVMDMAVNMGRGTAIQRLQRAINFVQLGTPVEVDGQMGPGTLGQANGVKDQHLLLLTLEAYAAHRYIELIEGPDPRYDKFSKGWLKRAMGDPL